MSEDVIYDDGAAAAMEMHNDFLAKKQQQEFLEKCYNLVHFIANDYYELSQEKIQWQRDDWKKRCMKLIKETGCDRD